MSRSFFGQLHRRYGTKLSGAERYARAHAKQLDFARWLGLASLPSDCGEALPNGVAIVGGGFAGIAAAWTLGQAGVASTVFEARKTYGGRVESDRSFIPGRIIEAGAELIGLNHPMWLELVKRFGLGLIVLTGEDQYAAAGLEMPLRIGGKALPDPEKLYEQMAFVLQKISNDAKAITDPFAPWTTPGAAALDAKSVADKIADFVRLLPKPTRHPMLVEALGFQLGNDNVLPTKEQSYLGLLALVSGGRLGPRDVKLNGYWEHNEDFRCSEGNDTLAGMMLEYGKRILFRPGSPVTKIEISETDPLVKLAWFDPSRGHLSKNFDYVVLTAPPSVWKKITITPALPPGQEMGLGPAVKYISQVHDRFWIKAGMAPSGASDELGQTWEATENQALASQGVALSVFAGGAFVPKSDAAKHFGTQLLKLYPGYRMKADRYADWPNVPWIETGYACPKVGQVTTIGKFLSVPHKKRLIFAGEHTCMAYFGYMEGALQSGARAAKAILASCSKKSSMGVGRERRVHEYQRAERVAAHSGSRDSHYANDESVAGVYVGLAPGQVGCAGEGGLQGDFGAKSGFGEQVLAAAEAQADDSAPHSSAALLELLLGGSSDAESEAEGIAVPLSPLGHHGPAPSATTLFNCFIYRNHPLFPRNALYRHYARRFKVLAYPCQSMSEIDPRPGDLLLRVARGEGWGHVAIVASRGLYRYDRLGTASLRGEGYPRLRPGLYIQVVEVRPRRRRRADRFARRLCDGTGRVLPDTLLLRPLPPGRLSREAEAESGDADAVAAGLAERDTGFREAVAEQAQPARFRTVFYDRESLRYLDGWTRATGPSAVFLIDRPSYDTIRADGAKRGRQFDQFLAQALAAAGRGRMGLQPPMFVLDPTLATVPLNRASRGDWDDLMIAQLIGAGRRLTIQSETDQWTLINRLFANAKADAREAAQRQREAREFVAYFVLDVINATLAMVEATNVTMQGGHAVIALGQVPGTDRRVVPGGDAGARVIGDIHTHYLFDPLIDLYRGNVGTTIRSSQTSLHSGVSDVDVGSARDDHIVVYAVDSRYLHRANPNGTKNDKLSRSGDVLREALRVFGGEPA